MSASLSQKFIEADGTGSQSHTIPGRVRMRHVMITAGLIDSSISNDLVTVTLKDGGDENLLVIPFRVSGNVSPQIPLTIPGGGILFVDGCTITFDQTSVRLRTLSFLYEAG